MEGITTYIEQLIATRNSEMEKIRQMFEVGDIDQEEKSSFETCIALKFKAAKASIIAKICGNTSDEGTGENQEGSTKRGASHMNGPSSSDSHSTDNPRSGEPAKRPKYDVMDLSDDGVKASAPVIKAKRLLPRSWKKVRGIREHRGQKVYVNPNGRPYKLPSNPILGQDFFLEEKDAAAFIAQQRRSAAGPVPLHPDAPAPLLVLQPTATSSSEGIARSAGRQVNVAEAPASPPVTPRAASSATPVSPSSPASVHTSPVPARAQVAPVSVQAAAPPPLRPICKAWHSVEHAELRESVKQKVHDMIKPYCRKYTAMELQFHVGYLESSLYVEADTLAAYADFSTLMHRLTAKKQADRNKDTIELHKVVPDVKVEASDNQLE